MVDLQKQNNQSRQDFFLITIIILSQHLPTPTVWLDYSKGCCCCFWLIYTALCNVGTDRLTRSNLQWFSHFQISAKRREGFILSRFQITLWSCSFVRMKEGATTAHCPKSPVQRISSCSIKEQNFTVLRSLRRMVTGLRLDSMIMKVFCNLNTVIW